MFRAWFGWRIQLVCLCIFSPFSHAAFAAETLDEEICHLLGQPPAWPLQANDPIDSALSRYYKLRACKPLFIYKGAVTYKGRLIAAVLGRSLEEGIHPELYDYSAIFSRIERPYFGSLASLDLLLTRGLVHHILNLSVGIQGSADLKNHLFPRVQHIIESANNSDDLQNYVLRNAPAHRFYARLKRAFASLYKLSQQPEANTFLPIQSQKSFREGDHSPVLSKVKKRLRFLGFYSGKDSEKFDQSLRQAVVRLQKSRGLPPDGNLGPKTLAEINRPLESLLKVIGVNMDRWRQIGGDPGGNDLIVNLAGFTLDVYQDRKPFTQMRVIIGKDETKSPVSIRQLTNIILNPPWNIPDSIAKTYISEGLKADEHFFAKHGIHAFTSWKADAEEVKKSRKEWLEALKAETISYRFSQEAGPLNPLGKIKFDLTGTDSIYLHDTPSKEAFRSFNRSFSHGCIRLEDPVRLALFLLNRQGESYTAKTLLEEIALGKTKWIKITNPLPVYLSYQTAWAEEDGSIFFGQDVYERDDAHAALLTPKVRSHHH